MPSMLRGLTVPTIGWVNGTLRIMRLACIIDPRCAKRQPDGQTPVGSSYRGISTGLPVSRKARHTVGSLTPKSRAKAAIVSPPW